MCKKIRIRQKKYKKYYYCCDKKTSIYITECGKCLKKEFRKPQDIKKITNKQRKLNNSRYSIFTSNYKECYYCHQKGKTDLHEVYGGSNRIRSIKNGLVVPLCRKCHSDENIIKYLRIKIQKEYEKTHSREEFIQITGKSYIKGDDK